MTDGQVTGTLPWVWNLRTLAARSLQREVRGSVKERTRGETATTSVTTRRERRSRELERSFGDDGRGVGSGEGGYGQMRGSRRSNGTGLKRRRRREEAEDGEIQEVGEKRDRHNDDDHDDSDEKSEGMRFGRLKRQRLRYLDEGKRVNGSESFRGRERHENERKRSREHLGSRERRLGTRKQARTSTSVHDDLSLHIAEPILMPDFTPPPYTSEHTALFAELKTFKGPLPSAAALTAIIASRTIDSTYPTESSHPWSTCPKCNMSRFHPGGHTLNHCPLEIPRCHQCGGAKDLHHRECVKECKPCAYKGRWKCEHSRRHRETENGGWRVYVETRTTSTSAANPPPPSPSSSSSASVICLTGRSTSRERRSDVISCFHCLDHHPPRQCLDRARLGMRIWGEEQMNDRRWLWRQQPDETDWSTALHVPRYGGCLFRS